MAYASRLYPRAEPRGFTLQVIKTVFSRVFNGKIGGVSKSMLALNESIIDIKEH